MPPRWTWPRIVMRVSKPVRASISRSSARGDPAEPHVAERVGLAGARSTSVAVARRARPRRRRRSRTCARARGGRAGARRPRRCRTAARGRGSRRRRRPCRSRRAIQPAWRPITSTTITRLWDSAVVCRRSIASVAICTAVWKPNVKSVPPRSLSIVFGTPTTWTPSAAGVPRRRACPRRRSGSARRRRARSSAARTRVVPSAPSL